MLRYNKNQTRKAGNGKPKINVSSADTQANDKAKHHQSANQCETFVDATNAASWIVFMNDQLMSFANHLNVWEYLTMGTINGKPLNEYTTVSTTIAECAANAICQKNFDTILGKDSADCKARTTSVMDTYKWSYAILALPEVGAAPLQIRFGLHGGATGVQIPRNITKLRQNIPGLNYPQGAALAALTVAEVAALDLVYDKHWSHVPKNDADIVLRCHPGPANAVTNPPLMHNFEEAEIRDLVYKVNYAIGEVTAAQLTASYAAFKLANAGSTRTLEEHCKRNCDVSVIKEMDYQHKSNNSASLKSVDFVNSILKNASTVTNKLQGAVRDLALVEFNNSQFHEGYMKITNHYAQLGVSDLPHLENSVRAVTIGLGESLDTHYQHLLVLQKRWATTIAIDRHLNLTGTHTVTNFVLDAEKVADSCGFISDSEYKLKHAGEEPYIAHRTRVAIFLESLSPSKIHEAAITQIRLLPEHQRTMQSIYDSCTRLEKDPAGQKLLKDDVTKAAALKRKIHDTSSTNLTTGKNPSDPCYLHGSGHTNWECRGQQRKPADSNKKPKYDKTDKRRKVNNPCEYCKKFPDFAASADWHENPQCFRDPKSPACKPNMVPKSVQLTHQINSSMAPMIEQMNLSNAALAKSLVVSFKEAINSKDD